MSPSTNIVASVSPEHGTPKPAGLAGARHPSSPLTHMEANTHMHNKNKSFQKKKKEHFTSYCQFPNVKRHHSFVSLSDTLTIVILVTEFSKEDQTDEDSLINCLMSSTWLSFPKTSWHSMYNI